MKKTLHLLCMIGKYYMYGFFLQLLCINLLLASNGNAQNRFDLKEVNFNLEFQNKSLGEVFEVLSKNSEFYFIYDRENISKTKSVNLQIKNESLESILYSLAASHNLSFRQVNERISVKQNKSKPKQEEAIIQLINISGRVIDESGNPLPGATILVKGSISGVVTDIDGRFAVDAPEGAVLQISFIGFETKILTIDNRNFYEIILVEDSSSLSEVVVVGFGTQNKRDVTGAISSVRQVDVREIAVSSPEALLQGKAPGVQIVQNSGTPGGEVFVRVRGTASLLGESRPLYVIDGVPLNASTGVASGGQRLSPLADINPNDIESMEILKDAAATAIYGSRGSNGVILITTKRGKAGEAKISFDAYTGVQNVWRKLDLLNGSQFVDLLSDALNNRNPNLINNPPFNEIENTGVNTNYQDEIFRPARIENYALSISGGNEKINTFVSFGYFRQEGTIVAQDFKRFSLRYNIDYQATKNLKIGTSTTLSNTLQDRIETGFSGRSVLAQALIRNPNLPVFDQDGSYSIDPLGTENPVMLANEVTFNGNQRRIVTNVYGEFTLTKGLVFRSIFGVDYNDDRQNLFVPSIVVGTQGNAQANAFMLDEQTLINDNTLVYTKQFSGGHNFTGLIGFGTQQSNLNFLSAGGVGAGSDIIKTIGAISTPNIPNQNITGWGLISYFGRFNYSYKERYLAEGTVRVDGSSRFGSNKRYGTFPGLSLGWRLSEEEFLKNSSFVSDLKLRFGVGVTGNQDGISNFASRALYNPGSNYDGNPGIAQQNIPNQDLGWESTTTTNFGLDFSILNGRVSVIADAYNKVTNDLLFPFQLPWTSGFSSIGLANIGKMENRGLELALSANILTGQFKWVTDFNISFNRVKILELPENGSQGSDFIFKLPDAFGAEGPYGLYRVGQPVGTFIGYVYDGVYPTDESVPGLLFNRGLRGGDARFIDLNDDGVFDRTNDRTIIGNALPQHIGGFTNNFSYKNFALNILFNWSYGNDIYNMTNAVLTSMSEEYNQTTATLQRWRNQGDVTQMPRALYATSSVAGNAPNDASSRFLENGSFLRMRNITFSYTFPTSLTERLKIGSARIYVAGQNLWTWTNYTGFDPENQNLGTGVPILGVDYLNQPQPRVYMVGINLGI
ncbi:TonB-dependent receptor [Aquiflexum sp.]|uniref:TonB-dependent receptor n=1 Tax=Aquiflexum sp. TaxID=1872584 RepID=UPI003593E0F3